MTALVSPRIHNRLERHEGPTALDPEVHLMLRVRDEEDGEAFETLVARYWPMVFGRFCRRLGDRQQAEDLAQELFLRLYRNRKRYRPSARFATWVYHIAENLFRNALRTRRRKPSVRLQAGGNRPDGAQSAEEVPDRNLAPSTNMEHSELRALVRRAINGLKGRQRTAFELHQYQDRTYAEIARELDITPEAAKSLLYRARNQLRASLELLTARDLIQA